MVRAPGFDFEFGIFCEGEYLPEYSIVTEGNKVTCWVPSKEGKVFEIRGDSESAPSLPGGLLDIEVYFDGSEELAGTDAIPSLSWTMDRVTTPEGIDRQICFSKLKLLESDDIQLSEDQIKSLGTIRLHLQHVRKVWSGENGVGYSASQEAIAPPALNERSKKGGGHVISLGAELGVSKVEVFFDVEVIPNTPSSDIIFHYAPKELLIAREIIPRSPSPPPVIKPATKDAAVKREREETDDDADALTDEEDAAAYARLRAKIAAKKRAKIASVKSEPTDISTTFTKGEIIYISD